MVVVGGLITLLVAANSESRARTCKGVMVSINNGGDRIYVEKDDVLKSMEKTAGGPIVNKRNGDVKLGVLEKSLEKNPWIRDAELYFDAKDILHVAIAERVPMARVFTAAGSSFYIDSTGHQLPLLEGYSAKLPVVTGFTPAKRLTKADSTLLQETKQVVQTISNDAFWNAQVGQIDITPGRKFELIPVLGSHVIKLGSGNEVAEKLARLMVFYKQVMPKAGFAKYSALDVQFNGQVVAVRRGPVSAVDSIQLQKNIEELMQKKAAEQEPDDAVPATTNVATLSNGDFDVEPATKDTVAAKPAARETSTTPATAVPAATAATVKAGANKVASATKKSTQPAVAKLKPVVQKAPATAKPKAVMPKKAANE